MHGTLFKTLRSFSKGMITHVTKNCENASNSISRDQEDVHITFKSLEHGMLCTKADLDQMTRGHMNFGNH